MIVGFTGTRNGMTQAQHKRVCDFIHALNPAEVHHGCCVGADVEVNRVMIWFYPIVGHPAPDGPNRALCEGMTRMHKPKPFSDRNQDIVDACDVLVAAPAELREQPSGGTWQTVRRARLAGKWITIVWPDGRVS